MSEVRTIESQYGEFRCTLDNAGNIWFVGNDIANILGYKDQKKAIYTHVSINNKTSNTNEMGGRFAPPSIIDSLGREQIPIWINEAGFYSLVMSSKLPSAMEFKEWVVGVVLPSLRKEGSYDMQGQTNDIFGTIDRSAKPIEDTIYTNDPKSIIEDKVSILTKISGRSKGKIWTLFKYCYNKRFHTNLTRMMNECTKYLGIKEISIIEYFEFIGGLEIIIDVLNEMIERETNHGLLNNEIAIKKTEYENLLTQSRYGTVVVDQHNVIMDEKTARINQFKKMVHDICNIMNYRKQTSMAYRLEIISFQDIPKEYTQYILVNKDTGFFYVNEEMLNNIK